MPTLQQNVHIINIPSVSYHSSNPDETSQKLKKKKTEKDKEKEKEERKEREKRIRIHCILALNYIKWTT